MQEQIAEVEMQEWKMREQTAWVENAGVEKSGADSKSENAGVGLRKA